MADGSRKPSQTHTTTTRQLLGDKVFEGIS